MPPQRNLQTEQVGAFIIRLPLLPIFLPCAMINKGGMIMRSDLQLNEEQYRDIWVWVDENMSFRPHCRKGHDFFPWKPFEIPVRHVVYGFENMKKEHADVMDDLIDQAFLNVTKEGQRIYALDWQHDGYLYDPRQFRKEPHYWFPGYYPDGDYYFHIDEYLQFGYLSHPWRQEVWIFGDALIEEFQRIYSQLGWDLLYEFDPS
jgi:hypothetical protein